jgi:hypothetical protein
MVTIVYVDRYFILANKCVSEAPRLPYVCASGTW